MSTESWNPYEHYVTSGLTDGQYHSSQFTRMAAGPPRLSSIGGAAVAAGLLDTPEIANVVYDVGLIQSVNIGWSMNLNKVFEIGSTRSYTIPGRVVGQLMMGSVYFHGPSLLRRLWAYYKDSVGPVKVEPLFANMGSEAMANPHDVRVPPGFDNLYLNLQSDLFTQPIGIMLYMKDVNLDSLGAVYFESVYVPTHNYSTDANGVMMQEQITGQFERMVPVAVSALPVVTAVAA